MNSRQFIALPYPVSANRYWRSFVPKGGSRAITTLSEEARQFKRDVQRIAVHMGVKPVTGRIHLHIQLWPNRPKDWAKRSANNPDTWDDDVQCIDLGNCEKVLSDALNGIAWADDKQIFRLTKERMEPDEYGGRCHVYFEPIVRQLKQAELL
jgi:crossover junction endodeoxyribonuclease RusA